MEPRFLDEHNISTEIVIFFISDKSGVLSIMTIWGNKKLQSHTDLRMISQPFLPLMRNSRLLITFTAWRIVSQFNQDTSWEGFPSR